MGKLLPTNSIVEMSGYSAASLKNFVDMGWIEPPILKSYGPGQGRGQTHWWKRGVIADLITIKTLKKAGKTNDEIDNLMRGE
jgi:hypothetical protein